MTGSAASSRIRRVSREKLGSGIVRLFFKQALAELRLNVSRRVDFRHSRNGEAVRAYCAMSAEEFEGINARQKWANWRTIPRNLHGRLPLRPCRAVDLCCGLGHSTQVLAYYLPAGSTVLGLEYNPEFVRVARRREYLASDRAPVAVSFRAQSVLDTFRDVSGRPLAEGSLDLVNCCGALGLHFVRSDVERLAAEIFRVLRWGGLATLDSGRKGVDRGAMTEVFERRGFRVVSAAKSCFLDRFTQVCFRKEDVMSPKNHPHGGPIRSEDSPLDEGSAESFRAVQPAAFRDQPRASIEAGVTDPDVDDTIGGE
ncbi:MAG: class I SAM-dependent methyltransferase [Elusimicrobia bacterium]|nr:class I SAM-dependent methyltransferase [Elusimicrobiota bacterium]